LDLDRILKSQDWIWIAKYDSPLISARDQKWPGFCVFFASGTGLKNL